jgi:hypothetical protein
MKMILTLVALALLALLFGFSLAAAGLAFVAGVIFLGDKLESLPCPGDCNQGRACRCMHVDGEQPQ